MLISESMLINYIFLENNLNLSNVLNHRSSLISKLVNFSICSDMHPEKVQIQNTWVVDFFPKNEINPDHLQNKFSHLKDVDFHLSDVHNVLKFNRS